MVNYSRARPIAIALAIGVVASIPAAKSSAAQSRQDLVILRGAEVETISFKQGRAAPSKGVVVFRGKPAKPRPAPPKDTPTLVAGDKLWFVDREKNRIGACRLWETEYVESWVIRCWSRPLPY